MLWQEAEDPPMRTYAPATILALLMIAGCYTGGA